MLTATKSGSNIILKTSLTVSYQLERKISAGSWIVWNGSSWGGSAISICSVNFTDYDLSDGVYQYRTNVNSTYEYSTCIVVGDTATGWTFRNYSTPTGQFGEVLTADDIRLSYLWGIDLTASNGVAWTDEQTLTNVEWSVYQLEKALNIDILPREYYTDDADNESVVESKFVIKEFPYPNRRKSRYNIRSRHRPIREVTRIELWSPVDEKVFDLSGWLRTDKRTGSFRIYPKQGNIGSFTASSYPWIRLMDYYDYPDAFHINYTTGFATAELIPEDLRDIVGKITALKMLNVIGDGLLAGFSSSSISLDGLSESFSSTQSATSAYFGARIKVYQDEIKEYISENKNKYGNFRIGSI